MSYLLENCYITVENHRNHHFSNKTTHDFEKGASFNPFEKNKVKLPEGIPHSLPGFPKFPP